ncbi:FkbM family methyltransferase [Alisedimentitalea sp. MJ-SS2]|uniref:FkbM family methyltransferase n=1 Tax=Aliisedimentitalea sp. MJ-SS2 TaxID=3049795 RepID=UPI00290CE2B3|nr:FkbM family methyltransferase [Alisedimentitalea sp. MJ-SS2]MDU8930018.1 FkbM family methyltransferase [Alisedimentitalea sp. MJ-SS2]
MTPEDRKAAIAAHKVKASFFEDVIEAIYSAWLSPGDVALDCGANVGRHTRSLADVVGTEGAVWAIEAVPMLAARIFNRLAPEHQDNVHIICAALSNEQSFAEFFYLPEVIGWSSLYESHRPPNREVSAKRLIVPAIRLDDLMPLIERCDFLKADLEHHEYPAFSAGRRFLETRRPLIAFEFGPRAPATAGFAMEDFFGLFDSLNYRLMDIFGLDFEPSRWGVDPLLPLYFIACPSEKIAQFNMIDLSGINLRQLALARERGQA